MKYAKIAVIAQLAVAGVLVVVFALQAPAKGGAHPPAPAATAKGDHGGEGDEAEGHGEGDHKQRGKHSHQGARAGNSGKPGKQESKASSRGGHDDDHGGGHGQGGGGHGQGGGASAPALTGEPKAIARALLDGNERYLNGETAHPMLDRQRLMSAGGQHPGAMVLGCADSRVPPELVFDRGIGELFVVRSAGNIAEPVAVGSLEYGFEHLHAKVLLVLGHEHCGAVKAALSGAKMPSPNLEAVVSHIAPGVKGLSAWAEGEDLVRMAVEANVRRQADELLKRSPILRKAVGAGEIKLLKAVYDLESGRVRPL